MKLLTYKAPVALLGYTPSVRIIILMHMLLEREIASRCKLTHSARLHRKQNVWGALRLVCSQYIGRNSQILTTYNQDRLHSHKG